MRAADWVAVAVLGAGLVGGGVYLATRPRGQTMQTTQQPPPASTQGAWTLPPTGGVRVGGGGGGGGPGLGDVLGLLQTGANLFSTVSGWF